MYIPKENTKKRCTFFRDLVWVLCPSRVVYPALSLCVCTYFPIFKHLTQFIYNMYQNVFVNYYEVYFRVSVVIVFNLKENTWNFENFICDEVRIEIKPRFIRCTKQVLCVYTFRIRRHLILLLSEMLTKTEY